MSTQEQMGFMIVFSGVCILPVAFGYSTKVHTRKIRSDGKKTELMVNFIMVWLLLSMIPVAIFSQSTLIGYLCFCIIYTLLGFRIIFFGLGYALGWDSENALENSVKATFIIIVSYISVGIYFKVEYYIQPFASAILVLGSNIHLFGLLIISSKHYRRRNGGDAYAELNFISLVIMLAGLYFSSINDLSGMRNTIIVYGILWLIEKYHEIYFAVSSSIWFYLFSMSALLYYLALRINSNPEFVVDMFKAKVF